MQSGNMIYYYTIGCGDYDFYTEQTFASETKYTEEEFDKLIEDAAEYTYQHVAKTSKCPRCLEWFEPADFISSADDRDSVFLAYLLNHSDLQEMKTHVYYNLDSLPKFDSTRVKDCRQKCTRKGDYEDIFYSCMFNSERIEAGKVLICRAKNREKAYRNNSDNKKADEELKEIADLEKEIEKLKNEDNERKHKFKD
jgi:hypothetical protein